MAPELIKKLILPNRQRRYELRNDSDFAVEIVKSVHKVLESLSYFDPKIWELLPLQIKETETFSQFKAKIKKWNPQNFAKYTCRMLDSLRLINNISIEFSVMDFVVKWALMSNKLLVCLHFLRQSFTEDSGFCSETIAFIYFKLCIYVYKPIYFRIYLFAFRLTWISICILHLLLLCNFFMCKELRF